VAGCVAAGRHRRPGGLGSARALALASPVEPERFLFRRRLYLAGLQTLALAPQYTFGWLPIATISDGNFIDGMVAVPEIYPAPVDRPVGRPISVKGMMRSWRGAKAGPAGHQV